MASAEQTKFYILYLVKAVVSSIAMLMLLIGINQQSYKGFIGSIFRFFSNLFQKIFRINIDTPEKKHRKSWIPFILFIVSYVLIVSLLFDFSVGSRKLIRNKRTDTIVSICVIAVPLIFYLLAKYADKGYITATNVMSYISRYPYDESIYSQKMCHITSLPAPARSKYCYISKKRVAKYDHYNSWLRATIGERNHRFYFLFLLTFVLSLGYVNTHEVLTMLGKSRGYRLLSKFSKSNPFLAVTYLLMKFQNWRLYQLILQIVLNIYLLGRLLCQIVNISRNRTGLDSEKIAKKKRSVASYKYKNTYSHGFFRNWKDFFFPPGVPQHPLYTPSKMSHHKKVVQ